MLVLFASCNSASVLINDKRINVVVADEPAEWTEGLQGVLSLDRNSGMLFIFPEPREATFWMKNTLIPLDMLFIDKEGVIQVIAKNVQPCRQDPCTTYSHSNIKYVLEVNAGIAEEKGIKTGDKIVFRI